MDDTRQTKLFIRVDGVIGPRRRICTFCNCTIEGIQKVVETTRKLRRGPYFPQLAYLQSSVGKIDSLGRAIVCLSCFHQLLRQWSAYENKNVPLQRRTYKYVSDRGVRNFQEARALEIRTEAEKRAFAIHTNREHVVKKSFAKLNKLLDIEEKAIFSSEQRIQELNKELKRCSKGERWKINREIQKEKNTIKAAEVKIEEEEDKEEEIRKETKKILETYRKNNSLFRASSEPSLFNNSEQDIIMTEKDIESFSNTNEIGISSDNTYFDRYDGSSLKTISSTTSIRRRPQSDDLSDQYDRQSIKVDETDGVWGPVRSPRRSLSTGSTAETLDEDWYLVKEIVYSPKSDASSPWHDVLSNDFTQEYQKTLDFEENQQNNKVELNCDRDSDNCESQQNNIHLVSKNQYAANQRNNSLTGTDKHFIHQQRLRPEKRHLNSECNLTKEAIRSVESFPDDEWSKLFEEKSQQKGDEVKHEESYNSSPNTFLSKEKLIGGERRYTTLVDDSASDDSGEEKQQMYTVNAPCSSPRFQHPEQNVKYHTLLTTNSEVDAPVTNNTSNDTSVDPWDQILTEKENDQPQRESSDVNKESSSGGEEYDKDFASGGSEKEVLTPRKLDASRFESFTNSSFQSDKPTNKQRTLGEYFEKVNYTSRQKSPRNKQEPEVTIIEKQENHGLMQEKSTTQSMTNGRNLHDRHLSVEEEEWERKHLNPKRLNDSKLFSFFNQISNENEGNVDQKATSYQKFAGDKDVKNDTRYSKHSNTRHESDVNGDEFQVECSPALKKLIRQDEISEEQPIKKTISKGSLRSDPWESLENTRPMHYSGSSGKLEIENENSSHHDFGAGRLELKVKKYEIESNKMQGKVGYPETPAHYGINDKRKYHETISQTTVVSNKAPKENISHHAKTLPFSKNEKVYGAIIIEEKEGQNLAEQEENDEDFTNKTIGRVDLSIWEQNNLSQCTQNKEVGTVEKQTRAYPANIKTMQTRTVFDINKRENDKPFDNGKNRSIPEPRQGVETNNKAIPESKQQNNLKSNQNSRSRSLLFNQNMSEDELAWEKRFSKSYDIEISDSSEESEEELEIQNTHITHSKKTIITESARLDENSNQIVVENISLGENEVRRIRNQMDNQRLPRSSVENLESTKDTRQFSDISQPSEEEAWEKRRSNPGKLDLSKFSQFI